MNVPSSRTPASPQPSSAPGLGALLVLDSAGRIHAANPSARQLWRTGDHALAGASFASLFAFQINPGETPAPVADWAVLATRAVQQPVTLHTLPREGAGCAVEVRLEPLDCAGGGYVAGVTPAAIGFDAAPPLQDSSGAGFLAQHSVIGFFDLQPLAGRFHFSPGWKRLLGYGEAELPDTLATWHDLIHPDDSGAAPDVIRQRTSPGTQPFNLDFRIKHRDGGWLWVQCLGVRVINAAGELERVTGLQIDLTERKEFEDTLAAIEARFRELTHPGPLPAFELDFSAGRFWFSPAWERLLGYSETERAAAGAEAFATALPPAEAEDGIEAWWLNRAPGQATFIEPARLQTKDGRTVAVLLGAHRTLTRKRELGRVVGFACPLPAEWPAGGSSIPAALCDAAFATLAEAVLITDGNGRIIFGNAGAQRLLQMPWEQMRGHAAGDLLRLVDRESHRPTPDPFERALSADSPLPLTNADALTPPNGAAPVPIVWTARAVFGGDHRAMGVVIIFRNPEEMTLTPEELALSNRTESLAQIATGIARDFNELLTPILAAVSLAPGQRDPRAFAAAEQSCLAARNLSRQLLAFAQGRAGPQTVCSPRELLEEAARLAAAGSAASVAIEVADWVSPVRVDRTQLLQVFQNLVTNALQAMPPPPHRPRLQLRAVNTTLAEQQVPGLAAGEYVEFEVRDNGAGIPPEQVTRIFEPFFTTKRHATGLGLATALALVRKHGGQIGLDTQVGVGTAFSVFMPKANQPEDVQARRAASLRFGTGRILVMDDDERICELTGTMLESLDYKYDLAKNGEEALALYQRYLNVGRPYDAVIMDLTVIGGMGGEECYQELKKLDPDVRAIVASGYDSEDLARGFLDRGFCGYLTKPYRAADLGKVLKTVLG